MQQQVGFALLGCGNIAKKHANVIVNNLERGNLIAVCDRDQERAQNLGEEYNVPWFSDISHMMEQVGDDIDIINILTPSGYHCANVLELVSYSKHLCVEKPIALTLKDADAMIEACDNAGIHLFVVKQNRFNSPIQKLKEAIEVGRLGKLVLASVRLRWCRSQSYYDQDNWRGTWELDGGVFANQASHFVDLLEWLMGNVDSVFARGSQRLAQIEVEDTGAAIFCFRSGAIGILEATTAARPKGLDEASLSVLGEDGTIEIGGFAADKLKTWRFVEPQPEDSTIFENIEDDQPNFRGLTHARYLETVVATILDGTPAAVDGRAGRVSLELLCAIYESIETGQEVKLDGNYPNSKLGKAY